MPTWGRNFNKTVTGYDLDNLARYTWHVYDSKGYALCRYTLPLVSPREEPPAPDDDNRVCTKCRLHYTR